MARSKKQMQANHEREPTYLSVEDAAFELSLSAASVSYLFDEAAADGVDLIQLKRAKRVKRVDFWNWINKNKNVAVASIDR